MRVPVDFFKPEIRDGFYISSEMKRCWASTLEVMNEIDKICTRHNLKYFIDYGTLLGAIRHGGFIPWDDDFDISMPREDYLRFLKIAAEELPNDYLVLSVYTHHNYGNFLSRVVNHGFMSMEENFLIDSHDFPFATGIDIFPLDYIVEDPIGNEMHRNLIRTIQEQMSALEDDTVSVEDEIMKHNLAVISDACKITIEEGRPIKQQLQIVIERLMSIYTKEEADKILSMYFWVENGSHIYDKWVFEKSVRIPFEYIKVNAPIGYLYKLKMDYGSNFMVPNRGGGMHDYPLYKPQKELMKDVIHRYYYETYECEPLKDANIKKGNYKVDKKEAVFLPFTVGAWSTIEEEYTKLVNDGWDVYVIPIPYYIKGSMRRDEELRYEGEGFSRIVNIVGFDQYDFDKRKPDRIYITCPYDDYDPGIRVHERFYSTNLKSCTNELIYIPYFFIDDYDNNDYRNIYHNKFYIEMPGVVNADRTIVQSQKIKERYVEALCDFTNANRDCWENIIDVREEEVHSSDETILIYEDQVPDDWWKYLLDSNGEGKKVILFYTDLSRIVENRDIFVEKIRRVIEVCSSQKDKVTLLWHSDHKIQRYLEQYEPVLWEEYMELVNSFLSSELGIYEDSEDYSKSVAIADAYYGDESILLNKMRLMKKLVMIQNYML